MDTLDASRKGPSMNDDAAGETLRVLIVEDNEALAQTTGWLIEMLGYDYRLASGAQPAIAEVKTYAPHVLMIDLGLPGMNGYDLCRHLKPYPELKNAVFIAQTGWGEAEHRRMSKEAGFDHHLVKPVYLEALEDVLGQIAKSRA